MLEKRTQQGFFARENQHALVDFSRDDRCYNATVKSLGAAAVLLGLAMRRKKKK